MPSTMHLFTFSSCFLRKFLSKFSRTWNHQLKQCSKKSNTPLRCWSYTSIVWSQELFFELTRRKHMLSSTFSAFVSPLKSRYCKLSFGIPEEFVKDCELFLQRFSHHWIVCFVGRVFFSLMQSSIFVGNSFPLSQAVWPVSEVLLNQN